MLLVPGDGHLRQGRRAQTFTVGLVDPQGVRITSFKAPTEEELAHDFLWRVRRGVPGPGYVGVFDRSHYEDVLIGRVDALADAEELERRYDAINEFERELVDDGCVVLKCMLHISKDTQKERLLRRLDRPDKCWKVQPRNLSARAKWDAYRGRMPSPWSAPTPTTHRGSWCRATTSGSTNLAVGRLLLAALRGAGPGLAPGRLRRGRGTGQAARGDASA